MIGLLCSISITCSKWSVTSPIDFPANSSGWNFFSILIAWISCSDHSASSPIGFAASTTFGWDFRLLDGSGSGHPGINVT